MTILDDLIGIAVVTAFILYVYSGVKKQSFKETLDQIKDSFNGGT